DILKEILEHEQQENLPSDWKELYFLSLGGTSIDAVRIVEKIMQASHRLAQPLQKRQRKSFESDNTSFQQLLLDTLYHKPLGDLLSVFSSGLQQEDTQDDGEEISSSTAD